MMRLVRKSSEGGSTVDKSSSTFGSGIGFFRLKVLDRDEEGGSAGGMCPDSCIGPASCDFFLDLKGFILMTVERGCIEVNVERKEMIEQSKRV